MARTYYQKFLTSVRWGAFESIYYQIVFIIHELVLCATLGMENYGFIGTLFAVVYLATKLFNLGLDSSLAPFFSEAKKSKQHYVVIVFRQLWLNFILLVCIPLIIFFIAPSFISKSIHALSFTTLFMMWFLIVSDGIQRSLRYCLYLIFANKLVALTQTGLITGYIMSVWGLYLIGLSLNPELLIGTLCVGSFITNIIFSYYLYQYYQSLPTLDESLTSHIWRRISSTRFFIYLDQLVDQGYSSNFMVPLFAATLGLKQAGTLTLVSSISYFIATVMNKTYGVSISTTLSQTKGADAYSKQQIFQETTSSLFKALSIIGTLILFNYKTVLKIFSPTLLLVDWIPTYLFLFIKFSKNFFITYENFFVTEEKAHQFVMFNFLNIGLLALALQTWWILPPSGVLIVVMTTRILSFMILALFSFYRWGIKPSMPMPLSYYVYLTLFSLSFAYIAS